MPFRSRLLVVFVLVGCLGAVAYAQPGWLRACGLNWPAAEDARKMRAEEERAEVLRHLKDIARRRLAAKQQVIWRLLDGQLTLLEAAAWFGHVSDNPPECPERCCVQRGERRGEKLCRQVIGWAGTKARERMSWSQVAEIVRRLEVELNTHLARHGTVELPSEVKGTIESGVELEGSEESSAQ
jgi:hypothetical protein